MPRLMTTDLPSYDVGDLSIRLTQAQYDDLPVVEHGVLPDDLEDYELFKQGENPSIPSFGPPRRNAFWLVRGSWAFRSVTIKEDEY